MTENILNNLKKIQKKYENEFNIMKINNNKKFFVPIYKINKNKVHIKSYDDMYLEMYFKSKYLDINIMNNINIDTINTGNIINDINFLMNKIDINFLHDNKFKICKYNTIKINNYFNPKDTNEIILYNSIDKTTYQQSEFRKQIWKIENIIKTEYNNIYNKNINISFYDDEKYDMVWIIITINDNKNDESYGFP
jgi:hypothetical protein